METEDNAARAGEWFRQSLATSESEGATRGAVDWRAVGETLVAMEARARETWPALTVPFERFVRHVTQTVHADEIDLLEALRSRHAEDLYLACACAVGDQQALDALSAAYRATLKLAIGRVDAAPSFVDEVMQVLRARLFVGDGTRPARIAGYRGRGPLGGWLAIAAQRTALNHIDHEAARDRVHHRAVNEQAWPELEPEMRYLKERYAGEFQTAFREALDQLTERERTLLSLRLVSGLTVERIGQIYGVNGSTASRWLATARERVGQLTQSILTRRLGLTETEVHSLGRLVASQVDVSIARLLAPKPPPPPPPDGQ